MGGLRCKSIRPALIDAFNIQGWDFKKRWKLDRSLPREGSLATLDRKKRDSSVSFSSPSKIEDGEDCRWRRKQFWREIEWFVPVAFEKDYITSTYLEQNVESIEDLRVHVGAGRLNNLDNACIYMLPSLCCKLRTILSADYSILR